MAAVAAQDAAPAGPVFSHHLRMDPDIFDEDASGGPEAHAVLGQRGAEEIATELLQADAIVGGDARR